MGVRLSTALSAHVLLLSCRMTSSLVGKYAQHHRNMALYEKPAFTFGVCADIQYVDAPDDYNFQKTKRRRYRQSLEIFKAAVNEWKSIEPAFAILLGDILDGKTKQLKNQDRCLQDLMDVCESWNLNKFQHVCGNHEYYSFSRKDIHRKILRGREDCLEEKLYYAFSHETWRFLCLDGYDSSLIGASSPTTLRMAQALLKEKNPNDLTKGGGWFDNLPLENYRYVPYNGGLGPAQVQWLEQQLQERAQIIAKTWQFFAISQYTLRISHRVCCGTPRK